MNLRNMLLCLCLLLAALAVPAGPLHRAAEDGDIDAMKSAIQGGEELDGTDRRGMTPLHQAAAKGRVKAVRLLLRKGSDPQLKDRMGRTAIVIAAEEQQTAVVDLLENWAKRGEGDEEDDDEDCD